MFWWIIIGVAGGIFGGMGMGGGTLLIPLVTMFIDISQRQAQLINLISFVIMAAFVLIIHFKNKLVNVRVGTVFAVFGVVFALITSLLTKNIDNKILKIMFGVFLIVLSLIEFYNIYKIKKQKDKSCNVSKSTPQKH